ncbi:hypothetical protein [Stenomitos frigidus]|uniref:WDGH domain-containing protein n=1 Tax=Stenomitos frigidus ULC18 TaxID=2107698 RepID=A0A2T1DUE4_9CYAN|nr:hypothetical protein [Stenomitos frigidus]PSB24092.1 hypothetical protein C7B82_28550 [Stenomitos frigidus ULC18]
MVIVVRDECRKVERVALDALNTAIAAKDSAYNERNQLIAFLARVLAGSGYTVGLGQHDPEDKEWEDDWRNIVYMELPSGQVSWHIHDSELDQFAWLPTYEKPWDGHDTPEKYRRLAKAGI